MGRGGAIRAGRAYVELYADNNPLVRGLKMAERRMRAFGGKLKALGSQMTMAGMVGTAPAALSVKWFASFDDAMRSVKAITGATAKEFEQLTAKARELGRSTSYTAADVAGAMTELGRAGFAPAEIDAAITGMLNLARATGTELPRAAEIAAATLRGFGLEAGEMAMAADVLVATANTSAQTLEDLGESMKYVAPIASEAGMSLQDTSKALGTLANMGIKGSMAGTSLRQILLKLSQTGTHKELRKIGVEALDASGGMRNLGDVMVDIGRAVARMPNAQRLSLMKDLFDQRAVTSAVKLSSEQFERLNAAIDNASGRAAMQAKEMDAGIGGAFRRLLSATQDVALSIGNALAPSLMRLAEFLTESANDISKFVEENQGLIITVAAASAGLLVLGPIVTSLGVAMLTTASAVGAVVTAIGLIASPVGLAAAALAAGVAAMVAFREEGTRFDRSITSGIDAVATHFTTLKSTVAETFGAVADAIQSGDIKLALQALTAGIRVELLTLQDMWASFWESLPGNTMDIDASVKRANEIADAYNQLTDISRKAAEQSAERKRVQLEQSIGADFEESMAELERKSVQQKAAEQQAAAAGPELPGWVSSVASTVAGFDVNKALQGVGQWLGEANQAVPEFIAGAAMNLTEDISPEAGMVSQIQRSARGTFSSLAAGRMGATGSATNRTERQLSKLVDNQKHANRRLDQFVDLATKAKLVFTGALPG